MAIVPVSKVTLYGTAHQKDAVLDSLQELACVHLVDLGQNPEAARPKTNIATETHQALKFLRTCPIRRRAVKDEASFQFDEVVREALQIEQRQQQLQNERDELTLAIRNLTPWGDFRLPPASELGELRLWFYIVPHYRLRSLKNQNLPWHVVSRDHRFAYLVVVSATEPDGMPTPRIHLDDRPLSDLQRMLEEVEAEQEDLHWRRVALTRWNQLLARTIAVADDRAARQRAAQQALDDPSMFAIQGWAPQADTQRIRAFARGHCLGLTVEAPSASDAPPTLLENRGLTAGGQDAVTFYTTPAYRAWDPSAAVFVSFSLFFAMIMADAGYAMLLSGLVLGFWRRVGNSASGLRLRKLLLFIVITSIAYGVAVGSYFGLPPAQGSVLQELHIIDAADTTLMMQISIAIGVAHLVLANFALAWSRRWSPTMLASFGWIAVFLGGLALGFGKSGIEPQAPLVQYGGWAIAAGIIAVLLFSSDRPLLTLKLRDHGGRIVDGLKSLTSISRAFGDVLSYLRLFALGLASAQLATTFNELTYKASCCIGIGSLLAVLVVVFGHGLNFALAIMSGVVHGLRLNCIEFFGWSLLDEGYAFRPFCKKAV
ncbi:MAG: V-type ATP synthase subunit I [Planctomycetaceae bacterium]|nr:ATPase V [Planctomycetales bacterium]MCB9921073.1 V-type ATP synthase subunit I [Planctomycetaceae bacterium]